MALDHGERGRAFGRESGTTLLAQYAYDDLNRLTGITYGNGTAATLAWTPSDSRLTSVSHAFAGSEIFTKTYGYNAANDVVSEDVNDDRYAWRPAANANVSYTANSLNQYTAVQGGSLTYTVRGDLRSDGANTYTYTNTHYLTVVANAQHTSIQYPRDVTNSRRMGSVVDGVTTSFVLDGSRVIQETSGSAVVRYVYGVGEAPVAMRGPTANDNRFLHTDPAGLGRGAQRRRRRGH